MKLGISTYTYGWAMGVTEKDLPIAPFNEMDLLERASIHGLQLVQMGDNLPLHEMTDQKLENFSRRAMEEGISVEVGARKLTEEHLHLYLCMVEKVEANLLRFVIDGPGYEPELDTVVGILKNFVPLLEERNIILGLENHDRLKAGQFAKIIESVGSSSVGICLDSVNSMGAGEGMEQIVDILAPYTVNLHIKDFGINRLPHLMGFQIDGRPAGKGMLNIPWLLEKIKKHSRCKTAILEQWVVPEKELKATIDKEEKWAEESLKYLKPLFK